MKKKNIIKLSLIGLVVVIILFLLSLIYKNLFADNDSSRYKDSNKYTLSNDEINCAEGKLKELDKINTVKVYKSSKIIKLLVKLNEDIDFESVKSKSKETLSCFDEENLEYYDLEIFISSASEDSDKYPQIGYKHKTKEDFTW